MKTHFVKAMFENNTLSLIRDCFFDNMVDIFKIVSMCRSNCLHYQFSSSNKCPLRLSWGTAFPGGLHVSSDDADHPAYQRRLISLRCPPAEALDPGLPKMPFEDYDQTL